MRQYRHHHRSQGLARWITVLVLGLGVYASPPVAGMLAPAAMAEEAAASNRPLRRTPALRQRLIEGLTRAQTAIDEKKPEAALALLRSLLDENGKAGKPNSYEKAMVWRSIGGVFLQQGKYDKAAEALRNVLAQENIPYALEAENRYLLAQLSLTAGDAAAALRMLKDWFAIADNPGPDAYVLLGQAQFQSQQYDAAMKSAEKALALARERSIEPKESWYQLLRALHYQKGDYRKTAEVLEELVRHWPRGEYWVQLAMVYGQLKKDDRQLYALDAAYLQGMLVRDGELLALAQLLAGKDNPYRAARIVDKGIRDGLIKPEPRILEFLGDCWQRAHEDQKAAVELEKAARASDSGDTWMRLGYSYLGLAQYDKAEAALRRAQAKNTLRQPAETALWLGQALVQEGKPAEARSALQQALAQESTAASARAWLAYLDHQQRQKPLAPAY